MNHQKLKNILCANKSTWQTLARNSFWLLLADGSYKGILFLVAILIARHFSVEEYGVFGFVFSTMTLIAMVADFGLANVTIREMAKAKSNSACSFDSAMSLKIILSITALLLMLAVTAFLNPQIRILAILAGTAILIEGMTDYVRISFRVSGHARYETLIKAATAVILVCLVFGGLQQQLPLEFVLISYIVAHILGLLLSLRLLKRTIKLSVQAAEIKALLTESWPMFLGLLCTAIYGQIDLVLIRLFRGYAEVGLYQAAYKLMFGFQLLRVIHMAMYPRLAAFHAERDTCSYRNLLQQSVFWSLMILAPVGILAWVYSENVIRLVFGQQYIGAAVALPFLIWSGVLSFVASFFSHTLMIAGRQRSWLVMEFLVLGLLLVIEVALLPVIGFMGAAVATFVGELIFLILIMVLFKKDTSLKELFFSGDQKEC